MEIRVECHAGYRGDESPRTLFIGTRRIGVVEVLDRWIGPDHRYFKVRGDDGAAYIIRHDVTSHMWELTMFRRSEG
jgi:hypothetical protein